MNEKDIDQYKLKSSKNDFFFFMLKRLLRSTHPKPLNVSFFYFVVSFIGTLVLGFITGHFGDSSFDIMMKEDYLNLVNMSILAPLAIGLLTNLYNKIDNIFVPQNADSDKIKAIVTAGATRLTPVLLTAMSTILGLMPLAIGMNINIVTLFTEFNPNIYFGGDNVAFWNPLAWTIIFGLAFATFLTLVVVPAMYRIIYLRKPV